MCVLVPRLYSGRLAVYSWGYCKTVHENVGLYCSVATCLNLTRAFPDGYKVGLKTSFPHILHNSLALLNFLLVAMLVHFLGRSP